MAQRRNLRRKRRSAAHRHKYRAKTYHKQQRGSISFMAKIPGQRKEKIGISSGGVKPSSPAAPAAARISPRSGTLACMQRGAKSIRKPHCIASEENQNNGESGMRQRRAASAERRGRRRTWRKPREKKRLWQKAAYVWRHSHHSAAAIWRGMLRNNDSDVT